MKADNRPKNKLPFNISRNHCNASPPAKFPFGTLKSKVLHNENMGQISTNNLNPASPNKWAELAGQLINRLGGKTVSMTYEFQQLTIDIPKAEAPGGKHLGSVRWTINGRVTITTETDDKNRNEKL